MAPVDARDLTKVFLLRLEALEEMTHEYQYVRNTLIEMNLTPVRYVARRFSGRLESAEDMLRVGTTGLIMAVDRYGTSRGEECTTLAIFYIQGEIKANGSRLVRDDARRLARLMTYRWAGRCPKRCRL
ncbi:sigma-70 family RNA polymerase sigma factor [Streptomyces kronopolitis]|uniref:sigma-70 family RNA polymerase sigma factor n=1 Tax=Streptomyces kronopolitis TaxID=1612435 RepID=UPI00367ECF57